MLNDNELIAGFMGVKKEWKGIVDEPLLYHLPGESKGTYVLEYDTSWDWIMPVVEKIQERGYRFYICSAKECRVCRRGAMDEVVGVYKGETLIESVYKTVVEFIKWYINHEE